MYSIFNPDLFPRFSLEEDIRVVRFNDKYIAVSPDTGGWIALDTPELYKVFSPFLTREIGSRLYMRGLARRNGVSIYTPPTSSELKKMTYFEFQLTDGCNLACDYCNVNAKTLNEANKASFDLSERLIDKIIEYCLNNVIFNATLQFSGGEPFTNFDVMEHTCYYAFEKLKRNKLPRKLDFQVQTNLALPFEEKWLEFIKRFQIGLGVSLDGPRRCHDAHRKFPDGRGSWDLIMRNLVGLKEEKISFGVISVITPESVSWMKQIAEFSLKIGVTGFVLAPFLPAGRGTDIGALASGEYVHGLFEVFDEVLIPYYNTTGEMPRERELGLALLNFIQPARHYMCWRTPCGAGTNICAVTPSGDVFPCGYWVNEPKFKMGNIYYNNFDEMISSKVASTLNEREIKLLEKCSDCLYRAWCQSRCPFSSYICHGDIFKPSGYCEIMEKLFSELLERVILGRLDDQSVYALAQKASHL